MAGKRDEVSRKNAESERLLRSKVRLLNRQDGSGSRPRLALDMLTGRHPSLAEGLEGSAATDVETRSDETAVEPAPSAARTASPRPRVHRRTVYLSDQDVQDIEFVLRSWQRRLHTRLSRSEVLRQAIGSLREAVELGAAPRPATTTREENGTSARSG